MNKNEMLYEELKKILLNYPDLRWLSEGEDKITAVRLPWHKVLRWKQEPTEIAEQRLESLFDPALDQAGATKLTELLLTQNNLISFKRPTKVKTEFDLYILTGFGWWYSGIKTKLIET